MIVSSLRNYCEYFLIGSESKCILEVLRIEIPRPLTPTHPPKGLYLNPHSLRTHFQRVATLLINTADPARV